MQPSRRSFLFGRKNAPDSPWQRFCQRLARSCSGRVDDGGLDSGVGTARLAPLDVNDVLHAHALCREYGVGLALAGAPQRRPSRHVLWLDPTVALTRLEPLADAPGLWRAEAGVRLEDLQTAGLMQFAGAPGDMSLAEWLAGAASQLCATGHTADAGVLGADIMLADGTRSALGPFGERDVQPLRGATIQKLVPSLFQLMQRPDAQICMAHSRWGAKIRLDALQPCDGAVNLAHLLLGHGGALAWVESLVLVAAPAVAETYPSETEALPPELEAAAARLDAQAKLLFDPDGLLLP